MEKKEFKIGEEFQFGLMRLKCVESDGSCNGCVFDDKFSVRCKYNIIGHCWSMDRPDNNNVIFVKVEE